MKNILIFGGSGFIGSRLVSKLLNDGFKLVILSRHKSINGQFKQPRVKFIYGKIENLDLIKSTIESEKIDEIIHLVSNLLPSSSYSDYLLELKLVVLPTLSILPFLSKQRVKINYFSSGGAIYGASEKNKKRKETDKLQPISYYGLSKLIIENAIKMENLKSNLSFLIFRPSNPYGYNERLNHNHGLIANCVNKVLNNEKIIIWGDGSVIRDYIYIDDLIEIVSTILQDGINNKVFNVGTGIGISILDIISVLKNIRQNVQVEFKESRSTDIPSVVLDISKISSYYKTPFLSVSEGINKIFSFQESLNSKIDYFK